MSFSDCLHLHHLSLYATFSDQTLSEGTKFCFCTPACLYVSVNRKHAEMAAGLSDPAYSNNSALTQKTHNTSSPESSLVQYQPQPNTNIHTISFSSLILHAHTRTLSHYNKRHMWWKIQSYFSGSQACVSVHTWVCLCIFVECREFSYNSLVLYKRPAGDWIWLLHSTGIWSDRLNRVACSAWRSSDPGSAHSFNKLALENHTNWSQIRCRYISVCISPLDRLLWWKVSLHIWTIQCQHFTVLV